MKVFDGRDLHQVERLIEEVATLKAELGRLADVLDVESERLDWLLFKLPGDEIRSIVGEMSDTSNVAEWRERLDVAINKPGGSLPLRKRL